MSPRAWIVRTLIAAALAGVGYAVWWAQARVSPEAVRVAVLATFADQFPDAEVTVADAHMRVFGGIRVRQLTVSRRGDPTPVFAAPTAVIYPDKEQYTRGRFVIRKVEIDGPTLALERRADGSWGFDGLAKPGRADTPVPTFVVTNATVTVVDRRPNGFPPVTLTGVKATLVNDPAPLFLNLSAEATAAVGELSTKLAVTARLNRATGKSNARLELPEVVAGPATTALVRRFDASAADLLAPFTGRLGLTLAVTREPNAAPVIDARLTIADGRYTHKDLPAAVEAIKATATWSAGRLTLEDVSAKLGPTAVAVSLVTRPGVLPNLPTDRDPHEWVESASLGVRHLDLTDDLFARLDLPKLHAIRKKFGPAGRVGLAVRVDRTPDGGWRRTAELRPEAMSLEYEKFRYPLREVTGVITQTEASDGTDATTIDLAGTAGGRRIAVTGSVAGTGPDPAIWLDVSGRDVPIDDALFDALHKPKYREALKNLRASGRGDFTVKVRQARDVNLAETTFEVTVHSGSLCHVQFPRPVEQVRGTVVIFVAAHDETRPIRPGEPVREPPDGDRADLRDFTGRMGPGTVWLKGANEVIPGTPDRHLVLHLWGKDCPVDDHLRRAVERVGIGGVWRSFAPRGSMSFALDVEIRDRTSPAPAPALPGGPPVPPQADRSPGRLTALGKPPSPDVPFDPATDLTLAMAFDGPSVTPAFFRYDLDKLAGQVRYEGSLVRVERMSARHGPSGWRLDAGEVRFFPDGRVLANLGKLDVSPLVPDAALLGALPPAIRRGVDELRLRGPMELSLAHVVVLTPPDAPGSLPDPKPLPLPGSVARGQTVEEPDPEVYWKGELKFAGASADIGVPCDALVGRLASAGRYHGTHLGRVAGNLWLDRATVADHPVTHVQAAFDADPQTPDSRTPNALTPVALRFNDLSGVLFRGAVGGQARVVLSDPVRYSLALTATDVRLEDVARHYNLGTGTRLEGAAQATVRLETVPDPRSGRDRLDGAGSLDVDRGHMLNLPPLVPLLKVLKLQAPDKTWFEEAHATFTVRDDRVKVDRLDLLGTALSLGGSGELDTAGKYVKFDFYTIWSQTLQRWLTTPFGDLTAAVSSGLFKIEVSRGADGRMRYDSRAVPAVTDPVRRLADRVKGRMHGPRR